MEDMINSELVKRLRNQNSWSQEELALATDLNLRTIQRIENQGRCSLESRKALASAFNIDSNELLLSTTSKKIHNRKTDKFYGYLGATVGALVSYSAITLSLINNGLSAGEAGKYYGIVGAICGLTFASISVLSKTRNTSSK